MFPPVRTTIVAAMLAMTLFAQGTEKWTAMSRTAMSITGDIAISPGRIAMRRKSFPLTLAREIDGRHLADTGKVVDALETPAAARLYKTEISHRAVLANGNTICGQDADARWILAAYGKGQLSLAVFSGVNEPDLDPQRVSASHDFCGTFSYVKAK